MHMRFLVLFHIISLANAFTVSSRTDRSHQLTRLDAEKGEESGVEEYKNAATSILSNFMQKDSMKESSADDPVATIDFNAEKFSTKVDLEVFAQILDAELYEKEWFVTGRVNPIYFSTDFEFQDPDVKVSGIEDYAKGVYKLFNQETSRAEIISTKVNPELEDTITCTWRLSGNVNIGPGLPIKPYICYTDFKVDVNGSGLITGQEDRFDIPGWDILLSAIFPFLIGKVTAEPAPPVVREAPVMPQLATASKGKGFSLGNIFNLNGA